MVTSVGHLLVRKQPASLNGYDSDVAGIKIWKDNGNGIFDRDAASALFGEGGVDRLDRKVGQVDIVFGGAADAELRLGQILLADDLAAVGGEIDRAEAEGHDRLTSSRRR